jgi:multidrug efflux pump subunit AcrA (membrane-fusion protein)
MERKKIKWGLGLTGAALLIAVIIRYSDSHAATTETEVKTVAVAKVTREDLAREVNLTAELKPYQDINVYAKVSGFIKDINVDIGDQVKAG